MKIQIKRPVALHEAGGKSLNEDFIWPTKDKASVEEELFIVCDGEGGPNAGENASKLVGLSFAKFYASTPPVENTTQAYLEAALMKAEAALTAYKEDHDDKKQMRATLSLLHFGATELSLAWVGDSQAYYYNHEKQELQGSNKMGIDLEETSFIEGTEKPASIHSVNISYDQISPNDYLFLGSKGIAEQVGSTTLQAMFSAKNKPAPEFIISEINSLSEGFTKDNYSCYLIQVEKVPLVNIPKTQIGVSAKSPDKAAAVSMAAAETMTAVEGEQVVKDNGNFFRNAGLVALLAVLAIICVIAWFGTRENKYKTYMAHAEELIKSKNYYQANDQIDSALNFVSRQYRDGDIPENEMKGMEAVAKKRKKDIAKLIAASVDSPENKSFNRADLKLSAQEYIDSGNESLRLGNSQQALDYYTKAEIVKDGADEPVIPVDSLAMAYLKMGNSLYDEKDKDCNLVIATLEKAFSFKNTQILNSSNSYYTQAVNRRDRCNYTLGRSTAPASQLADNTRGLAAREADDSKAETSTKDASSKRVAAPPKKQPTTQPTTRSNEDAGATRRIAQTSGINSTNLSPEVESRLRKALSDGKRFYSQAKSQDSDYLYKQSAIQLEQAAPVLDGSGAYLLAYLYHMGQGVDVDKEKALKYAQKSALRNWPAGHYLYAHLLLLRGNSRDTITAKQSLQRASDLNYHEAVKRLREIP